ncbi:MAG: metallophosphoesterase family protein [Acidobacteriaceae bacterium]|nr:metallophosphoesterase family protein [Acidobacteriaceae bacterium]
MQFLILSDLHANWHALEAVLSDAQGQYEQIVCCGDIVGYNPNPVEVLRWTRQHCGTVIRGNHDKVVAGIDDLGWFNEVAQTSARWTMEQLSEEDAEYLRALPQGPAFIDGFEIWHGSPVDEDEYLTMPEEAGPRFADLEANVGFFGHTHLQGGFFVKAGRVGTIPQVPRKSREHVIELHPDLTYMFNPGSVGQPRDRDPRAAYAIYDSELRTVALRRTDYAVKQTAEAIRQAGLPDVLGMRLFVGF